MGKLADIKIAKGYRFTGSTGAADLLARMNNPAPHGLVGILAPESGRWWAILSYKDVGYINNGKFQIDAAAILKTISDRAQRQNEDRMIHNLPPIKSVDWKIAPTFDAKSHTVEWAVRVKTQSGDVINYTICLLGRDGVLSATVVEPYLAGTELAPLKDLMKHISFKPGQLYTDYQKGDTVAGISMNELIAGTNDGSMPAPKNAVAAATKSAGVWGWWYAYVGVGILTGGGMLLLGGAFRRQRRKTAPALSTASAANVISNGNGRGNTKDLLAQGVAVATPTLSNTLSNGRQHNGAMAGNTGQPIVRKEKMMSKGFNQGARRRKSFDYHRFYTDTVLKLSSGAYTELSSSNGRANGKRTADGHLADAEGQPAGDMNQSLAQAHLDLIANQKELIEEQKRLLIQQAKLIEEKSKLIAEKSQLLDRQTELFERDLL